MPLLPPLGNRKAARMPAPRETPMPKPWIAAIHPYVPGRSAHGEGMAPATLVKLSANENPLGASPAALAARATAGDPSRYPDPDSAALRAGLGALHGIDPARIVMGAGSGELLTLAASGFAGPGDEVIHVRHGFSLYDIATRRAGATPIIAHDADYATDVVAVLAAMTERTRVVFLANPNNPTGSHLGAAALARLHAGLRPDILLVVDQAYAEYVDPADDDGALALAGQHGNVLVTRTFSKAYGLAGDRVGWATGAPAVIDVLNRIRGPFNLSRTAQAGALAALGDRAFVAASRQHNRTVRGGFVAALAGLAGHGLRALPSEANFVLLLFGGALTAKAAYHGLAAQGVLTRWLPGQGLPDALRITIGTAQDMARVADILAELAAAAR